jgi:hypothetical protein
MPYWGVSIEEVGNVVGVVLTLMVFSYLIGRNPAYRLALHLFLGASTGFFFGVVCWEILILRLGVPLFVGRRYLSLVPLVLGLLLLVKAFPRAAHLGNVPVGLLAGAGAAVSLAGALLGTLVPLVDATARAAAPSSWAAEPLGWVDGLLAVAGAACTLVAFRHIGRRGPDGRAGCTWPGRALGKVGRWFLVVAFGAMFGGAVSTALTFLMGRVDYIAGFVRGLF